MLWRWPVTSEAAQRRQDIYQRLSEPLGDPVEQLQQAEDDVRYLLGVIQEYENAITWGLSCLNCSKLMDKNYEQYVVLERLREWCDQQDALSKGESMTTAAVRRILDTR